MKTILPFFHKVTGVKANCGEPLEISMSSRDLNWKGVLVERGTSPYFYPKDVVTPNFYFAIEMENTYSWRAVNLGDEITISTEPGDIWMNPPNTPFTHNIDVPCNFLIVNITEEMMFDSFDGPLPEGLTFLNNYSFQDRTLEYLLSLLLFEVEANGRNGTWYVENTIKMFSNYFIRHYSNYYDLMNERKTSSIIGEDELAIVNDYISNNLSEAITIEDLADELNISKFHFLNEFKKYTGITPYQHLLIKRIDAAKKLLLDQSKKITTIAHELGFSDSSHFSRSFKKATGLSPKDFKKNNLD
ncbi:MAG: AraC family transcriptional regulator [Firmicutes bacterium]|nr:AraC family transcriptional regulator [Bacillota bacterium]